MLTELLATLRAGDTVTMARPSRQRAFDHPPTWTAAQRKRYCSLPDWAAQVLGSLVTPYSRGSFVLQVGYFQATGRF